ncbi:MULTISPECIES: TlpA family protein disulfide reductase [unclassified Desulfurobacterium]|uniref:TlpA family protein disulfide reductase n=1 Tax=unclassified Desulfurobacterium TaxID=2639089 RepID=UPI0003B4BC5D|nr:MULTISPECIES: redoxin domain-containing protein [unclassified Desulfurobacterium]
MDRRLIAATILIAQLTTAPAFADWYILLPKDRRPTEENMKEKVLNKKPYKAEKSKIPAPDFKARTLKGTVELQNAKGKEIVVFFFENPYSPLSEELIKKLDEIAEKNDNVIILCVDVNDADYPILLRYKKDMKLKSVHLTADSYIYKQFKDQLKIKKLPASIFIDKEGFVRFYSDNIGTTSVEEFARNVEKTVERLK